MLYCSGYVRKAISEEQSEGASGKHMYESEEAYAWSEFYYGTDVRYVELWYDVDHFIGFFVRDNFYKESWLISFTFL